MKQDDAVPREPGRMPSDSERKMWMECVHGKKRTEFCGECEVEELLRLTRRRMGLKK